MIARQIALRGNLSRIATLSTHNCLYSNAYITPLLIQSTNHFATASKSIASARVAVQSAKKAVASAVSKQKSAEQRLKQLQKKAVAEKKGTAQKAAAKKTAQKKAAQKALAKRRDAQKKKASAAAIQKAARKSAKAKAVRAREAKKKVAAEAAKKAGKLRAKETQLLKIFPDPSAPRRPVSAYALYYKEWLQRHAVQLSPETLGSAAKSASQEWNNLDESNKSSYMARAHETSDAYKQAKSEYLASGSREVWLDKAQQLKQSRPAKNGYSWYVKERFSQLDRSQGISGSTGVKAFAQDWNKLSVEEKQPYNERASNTYSQWRSHVQSFYE